MNFSWIHVVVPAAVSFFIAGILVSVKTNELLEIGEKNGEKIGFYKGLCASSTARERALRGLFESDAYQQVFNDDERYVVIRAMFIYHERVFAATDALVEEYEKEGCCESHSEH